MQATINQQAENLYRIEGELNMQTVPDVATELAALISGLVAKELTFDLRAVTRSDSAGVALLVDAMQLAAARQIKLHFSHLPQQMQQISGISGLLDILPVSPASAN